MKSLIFFLIMISCSAFAGDRIPQCFDRKDRMEFNESQVLTWREFMENKFTARAFVDGTLVRLMEDRQGHVHFEVDLDENLNTDDDRVEVIYNVKYGKLPEYQPGDRIIACGDFVVDKYSPHKAVIHWLHINPKKGGPHEDGFIAINGQVAGLTNTKGSKK
ncbi:hypothetical protein Bb109J_c2168 [Bdellovibrio bacteriovorus]|nr:DUF3465 domain-containing protein [Bdellovibrio bacteriovorus]AHZ84862.1 hypothetical protein EP01_07920 [Bdellovibrio bacteriovorus]BEV68748.1 hypothetical protein Bb109J_c2168 [Bdellovibrio bacteriovorus]